MDWVVLVATVALSYGAVPWAWGELNGWTAWRRGVSLTLEPEDIAAALMWSDESSSRAARRWVRRHRPRFLRLARGLRGVTAIAFLLLTWPLFVPVKQESYLRWCERWLQRLRRARRP